MPSNLRAANRRPRVRRRRIRTDAGVVILAVLVCACILQPWFSNYGPDQTVGVPLQGPSATHLLGTDGLGRDVLVRLFVAGRLDIALAILGVAISWAIGTVVGIAAVLSQRRWLDWLLQRVIDSLLAFPFVLFSLTLVLVLGPEWAIGPLPAGAPATLLAIICINWVLYARLARAETLSLVNSDFVLAARLLGYSSMRIVFRHLLAIVARTTTTVAAGDVLLVVSVIAALPFLGAGIQPPTPEWGVMMYESRSFLSQAPLLVLAPVAMLLCFGIGVTLMVDRRLRTVHDPEAASSLGSTGTDQEDMVPVLTHLEGTHG